MESSTVEEGGKPRIKRLVSRTPLFFKALSGIEKNAPKPKILEKNFIQQSTCESDELSTVDKKSSEFNSQNSNCSKKTSNELASVDKRNSTFCQKELLQSNTKQYKDHIKHTSISRQSDDHNIDYSRQIPRYSESHYSSSDLGKYQLHTRHDPHFEKTPKICEKLNSELDSQNSNCSKKTSNELTFVDKRNSTLCQKQLLQSNAKQHKDNFKQTSISRQSDNQNDHALDYSWQIPRYSESHNSSSYLAKYHVHTRHDPHFEKTPKINEKLYSKFSSSHSNVDTSCTKTYKYNSNFKNSDFSNISPCQKNSNDFKKYQKIEDGTSEKKPQRICSEFTKNNLTSIKVTLKTNPDSVPNTPAISTPKLTHSVSNIQVANSVLPYNAALSNACKDSSLMNDCVGMLISTENNFIPPPVSCDPRNPSDNLHPTAEKDETILKNNGLESTGDSSYADEAYFFLPEHLPAISEFILKVVKERSVSHLIADRVVSDLNRLFKIYFEGNVIDCYGSYRTGLAISTSDINLMITADVSIKKSFMIEIHRLLSAELKNYYIHQYEEGSTTYKCKINFTRRDDSTNCELAYLGKHKDKYLKMGKFLIRMCDIDSRVKSLIIAAKIWAEHLNINDVEDGKLHPIGFTLLVIHFLQHCENPVLPLYSSEKEVIKHVPCNDSCIGALWLQFLWYYSFAFNWVEDIVTVTSVETVSKKSKKWENYWMAIEDPFTDKNIAETVINKDVADYIKACFKATYNYFCNGPENIPSLDDKENEISSSDSGSSQMKFSFNDCTAKEEEDICETCYDMDDVCDDCKKKIYVQPMASVPKMTNEFLEVVNKALYTVYREYMLKDEEVLQRKSFVKNLEATVRKLYPDAQLSLFGSSANGFGFKNSDLDICMRFKSKTELKPFSVLKDLRYLLRKDRNFVGVIAIFNATIPILKFRYEPYGWRGDISLDNVLAVHNSELLYTYSLIDERCKVLGCALKLIAKKALIAEVTDKALSSYSYLIMVIHFLQQTNPPVLPVLQDSQFRRGNFELDHIVDNCNVWFCNDIEYIRQTFKAENKTPVEQLFLDLLDYYCSFASDQVITIRQKDILPHCEKMRLSNLFNIQDPFLVIKNLGCVVSHSKARETKNVLNKARQLFRTPTKEIPTDLEKYFFSTMNLTGSYKEEALCVLCGKFGHDQKDCRQSVFPFPKKNLKYIPRKKQYVNQKDVFKRKQMNRPLHGKALIV